MRRAPFVTRMLAALAAGLLAGGALAPPALAAAVAGLPTAPADDGSVASAAAAYRAAFPQMSEAAARAAFAQQLPRKEVYRKAAEDSATFGGSWFDAPSGVMHVAVTASSAGSRVEQVADRLGVRLRVHVVARSYVALQRQAGAVRAGTGALSRAASGKVGIDVEANQVVVAVPRSSRASLAAAPAGIRLVDATASHSELDACTSRLTCGSTVRAGTVLWDYGLPICSAGFTARTSTGQRYVYTAGHCDIGPGRWGTGAEYIGPMTGSVRDGAVDAGIIRVDNQKFAGDHGGEIYFEDSDHTVSLDDAAPTMAYLQEGDVVCLAANFSEVNGPNLCGVIGSVSDPAESGMVRVDGVDACTGDSGGGWYWLASTDYRVAYGLHSDSDPGCHGDSGGSHSWFSPIPPIAAVWGLTTETSATAAPSAG